jgi:hypothetical protein
LEEDPSRDRLADAYVEAVIMRRLAELNRFREQHVQHHNLSESDRREYIRNVLLSRVRRFRGFPHCSSSAPQPSQSSFPHYFSKKVVIDGSVKSDVSTEERSPSSHEKAGDPSYHLKPDPKVETSDDDDNCCPICLNEYKNGDEVCFSNNKFCSTLLG